MSPINDLNQFWKSLEERESGELGEFLHREFPREASIWEDSISRRNFIQIMGASLALAGLSTACSRMPLEKIVPYVDSPENLIPGKPKYYASVMTVGGFAQGILVETHEGRPTQIEGNPSHPANLGSSDPFMQAAILSLYDPDRSKSVSHNDDPSDWDSFLREIQNEQVQWARTSGQGIRILTEVIASPTLIDEIQSFLKQYPKAKWHQFSPLHRESIYLGSELAFGEKLQPIYDFEKAKVVLSLDGMFLDEGPGRLLYARRFAGARRVRAESFGRADFSGMNRLYQVESSPSLTGAMADHRLALKPSALERFARGVARELGVAGVRSEISESGTAPESGPHSELEKLNWITAVVQDLKRNAGSSLVVCGERQSPVLHALCFAMNSALGNIGKTVSFTERLESSAGAVQDLVADMNSGHVDTIFILGGNPAYDVPADLKFSEALSKVRKRIRLSEYEDETSILCQWKLPQAHFLETWGDALAFDGTASIQQPVCGPFYEGKSALDLFGMLSEKAGKSSHDRIRSFWRGKTGSLSFDSSWQKTLSEGVISGTQAQVKIPRLKMISWPFEQTRAGNLEVIFKEDSSVYDGRFANNGWLQELPRPLSKLSWTNAILLAPETAAKNSLSNDDEAELKYRGRSLIGSIFIQPGQSEGTVVLHLGYGRTHAGRVGNSQGFNAFQIQTSNDSFFSSGLEIKKTGRKQPLVTTQHHHNMEGRDLIREGTRAEFRKDPKIIVPAKKTEESIVPDYVYSDAAWGMSIDLSACIGCNACMIACQSENNIPIVGREEVGRGRSMHWIRVDRYYKGQPANPETVFQPVPCMHCETAPCEEVCPTAATNHSHEGLNQMIYNRCVGTRFCSNNCPYKVRRFNFFQYSDMKTSLSKMMKNPDVTVRSRGVMEKCSYCVQRIRKVQIQAELEDREIRDGEIVTACQSSCPTEAIVFGNLNDPKSRIAKLKKEPLNYSILEELGTKPRTTYLAKLRNPNPALAGLASEGKVDGV